MRLLSYMVTKDETDRYLRECLEELLPYVDRLYWFDESEPGPALDLFFDLGSKVTLTAGEKPAFSFMEDEAAYRQEAWDRMENFFEPEEGDWVLSLDADEFLRAPYPEYVKEYCEMLDREGFDAVLTHVHEVWTDITEPPMIRTDGFWGGISAIRICKWVPDAKFRPAKMGGGSIPDMTKLKGTSEIDILHYGYARQEDRIEKHKRYTERKGHNPRHISSILKPPALAPLPPLMVKR